MEEEFTYEQLVSKIEGASTSLFVLFKRLDKYYKTNVDPEENPLFSLHIAAESIRNFTYTLDTLAEVMAADAPEE